MFQIKNLKSKLYKSHKKSSLHDALIEEIKFKNNTLEITSSVFTIQEGETYLIHPCNLIYENFYSIKLISNRTKTELEFNKENIIDFEVGEEESKVLENGQIEFTYYLVEDWSPKTPDLNDYYLKIIADGFRIEFKEKDVELFSIK